MLVWVRRTLGQTEGATRWVGVLSLMGSAFCLGWIGVFMRGIRGTPAPTVVLYRVLLAVVVLVFMTRERALPRSRREWGVFWGFGSLQAATYLLYLSAYQYTTVAKAAFLHYLAPAFVLLLVPLFLKERLSNRLLVVLPLAVGGTMLLIGGQLTGVPRITVGDGLAICSALTYAGYTLMGRAVGHNVGARRMALWVHVMALPLIVGFNLVSKRGGFVAPPVDWPYIALLALISTAIAFVLFFKGLQIVPAAQGTLLMLLTPVINALLGWVVVGEPLVFRQIVGAVMIIVAAFWAQG